MCGRTACTLAPSDICKACTFKDKKGNKTQPQWRDAPGGKQYYTSYNVSPTSYTPVLVSGKHFEAEDAPKEIESEKPATETSEFVVQPMRWGLIPSWHSGDIKSVSYNMNNARSDSIMTKSTFKTPLQKGRRCVVIADGYFEWQTQDGKKQPHFIYFPQAVSTKVEDVKSGEVTDSTEWTGKRLLTMAGLFDRWHPKDGGPPVYSYSIITVDAHKDVSWIHERMPAILNGEDEVRAWLEFGNVPFEKAVSQLIQPKNCLTSHPVSSVVNNSRNKSPECVEVFDPKKPKETASSKFMSAWLGKGTAKKRPSTEGSDVKEEVSEPKKVKKEEEEEEEA